MFGFATVAMTGNQKSDDGNDGKSDEEDEPEWTDDKSLFLGGDNIIEVDSLTEFNNAKRRKIIYCASDVASTFWHDNFTKLIVIFFYGEDGFTGEKVVDIDGDDCVTVDVASILNGGRSCDVIIE